jgi:signal transduction histidine kinase/pSer/pThr/pTyr-binding forkhead associated (FHA) protein
VPSIIILKGLDEGRRFELLTPLSAIGRDQACFIRLQDTEISRRHAEVYKSPDGFRFRDLGSANGCFVNCKSVRDVLLKLGDQIQVGQTVLLFAPLAGEMGAEATDPFLESLKINPPKEPENFERSFALLGTVPESEGSALLSRPEGAQGDWLRSALARLGVIYETINATSQILDIQLLLDRILGLVLKTLSADHGSVLLSASFAQSAALKSQGDSESYGDFKVVARASAVAGKGESLISRTVVDHVMHEKIGVLVSDAMNDSRFNAVQSIVRSGVREIICVPMRGRHATVGVIYLDKHPIEPAMDIHGAPKRNSAFEKEHLTLAIAVAHQAALAVEDTLYYKARVQGERLAAVGEAVSHLSHHIKNILQGLKSGGEILKMGVRDQEMPLLEQGLRIIEKNHTRLFDLVKDMLGFSKDRLPAFQEKNLVEILTDVVELSAPMAKGNGAEIRFETFSQEVMAFVDPEGIHRTILNLVNNAIDAIREKSYGLIIVGLKQSIEARFVEIVISDNGEGIAEADLKTIFAPFQSSKGNSGTGLGLAVARKTIEEHKGVIWVESIPNEGASFFVKIPLGNPLKG